MSADHTPSQDAASVMRGMTVEDLKAACEEGSQAACAELDRRGVEPDVLEPVPPIHAESLDVAQEGRPNASWLRGIAETLKFEASLLHGHAETYADEFVSATPESDEEERALKLTFTANHTASLMELAADELVGLAKLLPVDAVGGVPVVADPFLSPEDGPYLVGPPPADAERRTPPHGDPLAQ